jgi:hypothetical protein
MDIQGTKRTEEEKKNDIRSLATRAEELAATVKASVNPGHEVEADERGPSPRWAARAGSSPYAP